MDQQQLSERLAAAAFAFRGYNITNLGRSDELLARPDYGPVVKSCLDEASEIVRKVAGRRCDLAERVRQRRETDLASYGDAIAMIVAMEISQIRLLEEFHGVKYADARLALGYSLGEITALAAGGVIGLHEALQIPLALADDCVELARDVTLGILFSRGNELPVDEIIRDCLLTNQEGRGVVGVSTYLSPNSALLMGQQDSLSRFHKRLSETADERVYLRKNDKRWPPLHTPIVWEKCIADRCSQMLHQIPGGFREPKPPIFSLATGAVSYTDANTRELLRKWIDHPQQLWDAIYHTLTSGIETVIHVGPAPNIFPATYKRLRENVSAQVEAQIGTRTMARLVTRPWLSALLPERTALLRVLLVEHVILEDWLLEQEIA